MRAHKPRLGFQFIIFCSDSISMGVADGSHAPAIAKFITLNQITAKKVATRRLDCTTLRRQLILRFDNKNFFKVGKTQTMSTPRWKNRPEGSTWGDFGPDDQCGRLN